MDTRELIEKLEHMAFYLADAHPHSKTLVAEESYAAWRHIRDELKDECRALLVAMRGAGIVGFCVDLDGRIFQARVDLGEREDPMPVITCRPFGEELVP
jgi:hypothetical protein